MRLPFLLPGKVRFRSLRSGVYRLWRSKPMLFTTGARMSVPRLRSKGGSWMSLRMAPVPLISSPWTAAVMARTGPSSSPRQTRSGRWTPTPVKLSPALRRTRLRSPGLTMAFPHLLMERFFLIFSWAEFSGVDGLLINVLVIREWFLRSREWQGVG